MIEIPASFAWNSLLSLLWLTLPRPSVFQNSAQRSIPPEDSLPHSDWTSASIQPLLVPNLCYGYGLCVRVCVCVCVCVSPWLVSKSFLEKVKVKVAQSCLTLCDPMDYTVHGIL